MAYQDYHEPSQQDSRVAVIYTSQIYTHHCDHDDVVKETKPNERQSTLIAH